MKLHIKKGLDLRLQGEVKDMAVSSIDPTVCAIIPDDYPGFIPKLDVHEGDAVLIGTPIAHDKQSPEVCLTAPVSGTVKAIVRGERRKILRIEIQNDGKYAQAAADSRSLFTSGLFAEIRRRPYDIVPRPDSRPVNIFVTALDTAPLAASLVATLTDGDAKKSIEAGVKALAQYTDGKIYLSVGNDWTFGDISGAEMVEVSGPHPAGNPGIQMANIAPVNKGQDVWTLDVITLYKIGKYLTTGVLDTTVTVALTGPEVKNPCMIRTRQGADIAQLVADRIKAADHAVRVISGNVLTGTVVDPADGYLHFPWRQITVIADGGDVDEFMGWASLSPSKLSAGRTFPLSRFKRLFTPDSRLNGGRRAMIMSGEYDRVLPADIMLEYLLKAILSKNIEDMEALGIYEIAPEDVALCEFVDTSKLPVQQIVRDGLDYLRRELE